MNFSLLNISLCIISILLFIQIRISLKLEYHKSTVSHEELITELNDETVNRGLSKYLNNNTKTNNVTTFKTNDMQFSACLMVKDENHNLPEWIAYHYTMTNLQHLILCLDPYSKTSPLRILSKWKNKMNIEVWNHTRYYNPDEKMNKRAIEGTEGRDKILATHRARQRGCYSKCMRWLKEKGMAWTMLIDVDEYLTFNPVAGDDNSSIYTKVNAPKPIYKFNMNNPNMARSEIMKDQGVRLGLKLSTETRTKQMKDKIRNKEYTAPEQEKKLKEIELTLRREGKVKLHNLMQSKITGEEQRLMAMRVHVPNNMNITIPMFLKQKLLGTNNPYHSTICIPIPRLQFGSIKSTPTHPFNTQLSMIHNLTTLKFFHHYQKGSLLSRAGKYIVDVSHMKQFSVVNPHYINKKCTHRNASFPEHYTSFFRINHYSGTKETYLAQGGVTRIDKVSFLGFLLFLC